MPANNLLRDLGCRSNYICRPCLLALPSAAPPNPQGSRAYSRPSRKASRAGAALTPRRGRGAPVVSPPQPPPEKDPVFPRANIAPSNSTDDVTFRYFDMDERGRTTELRDNAAFADSMSADARMAQAKIEEMERQLQKLKRSRGDVQVSGLRGFLQQFGFFGGKAEAEREKETEADENEDDSGEFAHAIDVTGLPVRQTREIRSLNWNLKRTAGKLKKPAKVKEKMIHSTWRLYSAARPALRNSWGRVPEGAWAILWDTMAWEGPENTNRMGRIYRIGKDMRSAGIVLDDARSMLHIEAWFISGARKEALEAWRRFTPTDSALEEEYLKLGVRMYSIQGDIDRAGRALDKIMERPEPPADPRFMLPFIRACTQNPAHHDKAWATYRLFRETMGDAMGITDYDDVVSSFLLVKKTEAALQVFVDMMFSGKIDLYGKTRLPMHVANHFFMGKWLKRLIGAGDLDGALEVLRFMQSKKILAAKVQVNGLIGAWLRSGVAANVEKGEKLAWAMIRSRRLFVDMRRREALVEWPVRLMESQPRKQDSAEEGEKKEGTDEDNDLLGLKFVPQASLETFSLMAENYRERRKHAELERLWVAFQGCEITTDAFMLNQLLESYNQEGEGERARNVYRQLTELHSMTPDAGTFFQLYKSLAVNRIFWTAVTEEIKRDEFGLCREIFRDMISSSWTFRAEANDQPQHALVRLLLHSFRKCDDHVGLLVALRALYDIYGVPPAHVVCLELLAESPDLAHNKKKIFNVSRKVQLAYETAAAAASDAEAEKGELDGGRRELSEDEKMEVLVALLQQHYMEKSGVGSDEEFAELYDRAVVEMGLSDVLGLEGDDGKGLEEV